MHRIMRRLDAPDTNALPGNDADAASRAKLGRLSLDKVGTPP
jgi:hypothetical protein